MALRNGGSVDRRHFEHNFTLIIFCVQGRRTSSSQSGPTDVSARITGVISWGRRNPQSKACPPNLFSRKVGN